MICFFPFPSNRTRQFSEHYDLEKYFLFLKQHCISENAYFDT